MLRYAFNPNKEKSARAYGRALRISRRSSSILCSELRGMNLVKGTRLLNDLVSKKRSLNGKYYTNTAKGMLDLLGSAQANAEAKGLDPDKLSIYASAHKGFTFWRSRRFKMGRQKRKICNLQVVLMQR